MKKSIRLTRSLAVLMALVLLIGTVPAFAHTPGYSLQGGEITTHFLGLQSCSDTEGVELAPSTRTRGNPFPAPSIENHSYVSYTADITQVFAREHLPYIIGFPNGGVGPEQDMTRAEAAMVFHRMFWWTRGASEFTRDRLFDRNTFDDVPLDRWFAEAVETLYNIGVIHAEDGRFRPNDPITREEFAVMAARFERLREVPFTERFSDVQRGDWSAPYIHAAAERGWVVGYPDGTFRPTQPIIRAEVVTLINRVLERTLAPKDVPPGVNPYNDIAPTHWAYGDIIEATIRHDLIGWHGTAFNDGEINIIIERFVDQDGKEIAEPVIREGVPERNPRTFDGYAYYGFISEIVFHYQYTPGEVRPWATKLPNTFTAEVGQTIVYTITVGNDDTASYPWREVVVTDEVPDGLIFQSGSVYIDRESVPYTFANGVLRVPVGDIEPGEQVQVQFQARVAESVFNSRIYNVAIIKSENMPDVEVPDDGVEIADGRAFPEVTKTANRTTASVGDRVTYTVTVANGFRATVPWRNVVLTDALDPGLTFEFGSVLVNGRSTEFVYADRTLTVELGDIAPDTSVTVRFSATVNSTAIGQTIRNTALVEGSNGGDSDSADDIEVDNGTAWGQVRKEADRSTATVGDTITYTVTATNVGVASGPWRNVVVTDEIPEHLEFIEGSVTVNSSTANVDSNFSAAARTLTVRLGNIAPGATTTVTFRARVLDGAQGAFIVNTAIVNSTGQDPVPAPDRGVEINAGEPRPSATKTSSHQTIEVGERVTYTITLRNAITATAPWRNVVVNDVLPAGFSFVHGSVMVDGVSHPHGVAGQAIRISVGDIAPGQTVVITLRATALESGMGQTWYNVATIGSDNDSGRQVTCDGTTIPNEDLETGTGGNDGDFTVTATKATGLASVRPGERITYTITAHNPAENDQTWHNVTLSDLIDTGAVTFISGTVTINSVPATAGNHNYRNRLLTVSLGDLVPGQSAVVQFQVVVKPDAQDTVIHNTATLIGSSTQGGPQDTMVRVSAQVPVPAGNFGVSGIHMQLFQGYTDGTWRPENNIIRSEAAIVFHRILVRPSAGTAVLPPDVRPGNWAAEAVAFFLANGAMSLDGGNFRPNDPITMREFNRLSMAVLGRQLVPDIDQPLSRIAAAALIADAQGRSHNPNTNGLPFNTFSDVPGTSSRFGLVTEMSTDHGYYLCIHGHEHWEDF